MDLFFNGTRWQRPRPQGGGIDQVFMPSGEAASTLWIIRPCPACAPVPIIPQGVKGVLPAGRRNVERFAGRQLDTGNEHMQMGTAVIFYMLHSRPAILFWIKPCKGDPFKVIEYRVNLLSTGAIFWRPGNHTTGIALTEIKTGS